MLREAAWRTDREWAYRAGMRPQVRFCTSYDGTRIAYAITGEGPPLVRAPHWFSHLEHDWTNPAFQPWVEDLSKRYSFLRFDQRGCGLSDREVPEISPEAHVRDLECVVDAAGFERFAIFGASQGSAFAVAYAARHPERVSHLLLYGGFARGWAKRGSPTEILQRETQVRLIELGWGGDEPSFRQVFTTQFMPDASLEVIRAFNDMMPLTSSAKTAAEIFRTNGDINVEVEARGLRCPTLVAHGTGDLRIPFEEGRRLAGLIPQAAFLTLETRNHLMLRDDPAWRKLLDAIVEFYPPRRLKGADGFPQLTARERDVLELIAQGLDNAQIAARLALSEKTVRNNITHIFDKIQVENRSQAIVLARDHGLGQQSRQS
ncbi:MAG TPA: alpha/beta fold hydrolase [Burkholderiales bacterium]|nr:alpha/beta fold hydrolase [Burkholderiales bacterium]